MKKFISTITAIALVLFTNSCRQEDEESLSKPQNYETKKLQNKSTDSLQAAVVIYPNKPIEADPPPKNGHQW